MAADQSRRPLCHWHAGTGDDRDGLSAPSTQLPASSPSSQHDAAASQQHAPPAAGSPASMLDSVTLKEVVPVTLTWRAVGSSVPSAAGGSRHILQVMSAWWAAPVGPAGPPSPAWHCCCGQTQGTVVTARHKTPGGGWAMRCAGQTPHYRTCGAWWGCLGQGSPKQQHCSMTHQPAGELGGGPACATLHAGFVWQRTPL